MLKLIRKLVLSYLFLSLLITQSLAQSTVKDSSISMWLVTPSFAFQLPAGDLSQRFGSSALAGLSVTYKAKSKIMFSLDGGFIFGNKIKEPNLFNYLATNQGYVIGSDGLYANIQLNERGYYATLSAGYLFAVKKPNPNSGFVVQAGAGFIQHKIKIVDKKNSVPSLQDEYAKGYDRLTNGLVLRQYAGYMYIGTKRLVNFCAGIELLEGITQDRRDYNFDSEGPSDKSTRLDILLGFKLGWIIPLYPEAPQKFYTY